MTLTERRRIIRTLTAGYKAHLLQAAAAMPEEWNAIEIRQYMADRAKQNVFPMDRARSRAYRNAVTVRNVL